MAKFNEKYFKSDQMHINSIDDMLEDDEEIIWTDKPKKSAFVWSKILSMLPIALIWILFDGLFIFLMIKYGVFNSAPTILKVVLVVFFVLHLTPVWIWISNIVTACLQHKNIEYALTSKRLIIRSGIIVDMKNLYYQDIQSVNLRVGLIDKLLKVGDIYITSNNMTATLFDIENPYVIANKLQKIVNDIKTDIYYPNELRPKQNSGYHTKYQTGKNSDNKN